MFDRVVSREVAILGYGCRLPGAASPDALWALLREGRCAVGEIGPDRWSRATYFSENRAISGVTYTTAAGVLDDPFAFDAGFFGVSPREAVQMDPQQRLMLHVAWEAVEMAGFTPAELAGSRTGVYVGASGLDYGNSLHGDPSAGDAQFMTGNTLSIIANRLAHLLDARGPSYVVDTACSSSLFAFEAAHAAIASGRIDRAVVGGVNLLLSPMPFLGFARAGMLSPTGLCKPFDARADGYVRAEGAVAFVIEARETAEAEGRLPRGFVVGAAVNSDGRQGALSVPNGERQADLMRKVYADAGASADDLAFVEAHGTGTAVGDPIEASAIGGALGCARGAPLPVGSTKSNIGHLEPASGLAGLLKAQLALENGLFPPTLHVESLNPMIDFDALNLRVATDAVALPRRERPWIAGVNSFGFGGANAHVAIRQPDAPSYGAPQAESMPATPRPLILSAASTEALRALARSWRERLAGADAEQATALTSLAAHRRARHARRLVVAERDAGSRLDALSAFAEGGDAGLWAAETAAAGDRAPVAFVFSGNGSQWPGMGRAAFAGDAAFRSSFEATAAYVLAAGGPDIIEAMHADDLATLLSQAEVAQPLLLGLQAAIVDALAARGVRPMAVAGHSVGEVGAAWASGALSREQAARLAVSRARLQAPLHGKGAMAAVLAPADVCAALIAELGLEKLDIAADNSPRGATVSGASASVDALIAAARDRRIAVRRLKVDYPYHGPLMEQIRESLLAELADLAPTPTTTPFISSTDGGVAPGEALDGRYWWRNARQPVLFRQAALALSAAGARAFVEIGPQPSLQNYVADTLSPTGAAHVCVPSMRRQGAGAEDFGLIAARIAAAGGAVDDEKLFGPRLPVTITGPAYPWSLKDYRFTLARTALNVLRSPAPRPLLGWRPFADEGGWRVTLDQSVQTWLADHAVDGVATLPAAAFAEMALAAAAETFGEGPLELADFDILLPLTVEARARVEARTTLDAESGAVRIESRAANGDAAWTLHAAGTARAARREPEARPIAAAAATTTQAAVEPDPALYEMLAGFGLEYGPAFRRAARPDARGDVAVAALAPSLIGGLEGWRLDPTDLDAAFHVAAPLLGSAEDAQEGVSLLPVRLGRLTLLRPGAPVAQAEARLTRRGARGAAVDFTLRCADGSVAATVEGARFAAVRLRRMPALASMLWRQTMTPRRLRSDAPSATPDGWRDPAARLAELGLTGAAAPAEDDGALLLDAMARRIAWDATMALGPEGGVRLRARKALPRGLRRALELGLEALAQDGAYDAATDALTGEAPAPDLEALVAALVAAAPGRAAAMMEALALAERFDAALSGRDAGEAGDAAPRRRAAGPSPAEAAGAAALAAAAADIAAAWPPTAPLDVLIVGSPVADRIATALGDAATRLRQVAAGDAGAALSEGPWDLILLVDAASASEAGAAPAEAAAALANGGMMLAALPEPTLIAAMALRADGAEGGDGLSAARAAALSVGAAIAPLAGAAGCALASFRRDEQETPARVLDIKGRIGLAARQDDPACAALTQALAAAGARALPAPGVAALTPGEPAIIFMDALADVAPDAPTEARLAARMTGLRAAAEAAEAAGDARLWLVAPGALSLGADADPEASALARLRRVLVNERPGLRLGVIDADDPAARAAQIAAAALGSAGNETELMLRADGAAAPRAVCAPEVAALAERRALGPNARDTALALAPDATGGLETLRWRPVARRAPGPGEIEVAVAASGLNFRDVMWAMGVLPEEAVEDGFAGAGIGMECAGVVCRAGPGARFRVGDRVLAFTASALATHATLSDGAAALAPEGLDMAAAATLPVVFGTAWRGLIDLGRLEPGETVLVHGGAGGVGLAAIQIARGRGARVIATASTPEKRALTRTLGADAAFDSRTLAFADAVMDATDGRGVDVALNSLSGAAMEATLGCMAAFGRFIELGKRDYYANTRIGLRPMRRNIAYHGVDLDAMLKFRPDSGGRLLAEIAREVEARRFAPLPYRLHEPDEAIAAFRLMQRAGHVGKVIVAPPEAPGAVEPAAPLARAEGAYLVTGGARGFGLAFAERLAARGARRLWLTSRSGAADAAGVARLRAKGARVEVVACDAADEAEMTRLLERIDAAGAPLLGVGHAAMALDDGLMSGMTAARIAASLRPKLTGAEVLDRLTRGRPLDFFVLFSSVSALFGNPGQGPYVAANAGLEAIAARRRAAGAPGLAMGFGPISDTGVLAEDAKARERLERRGAGLLTSRTALDALEAALAADAGPALTAAPMRWGALSADLPVLAEPIYERFDLTDTPAAATAESGESLAAMIAGLDEAAAVRKLAGLFRAEAAIILRQPPEEVDPARPLAELGFDSLMGMELKLSAEEKFGATLPAIALADGATLTTLAARMVADLRAGGGAGTEREDATLAALASRHVGGLTAAVAEKVAGAVPGAPDGPQK
ncbi:type I polyketide synthase [Rubrimonas cliftonensis]|uniref:type I polyketide synthase n=1 Tax=Rubrimonas cliftonensis TaxID=89524 RepID=UPI001587165D|nr:type I polyketide synthase [Rubrimonas cliftonensis]